MTTRRPLTSRDLLRLQGCAEPQLAPDRRTVAWVRSWIDAAQNSYRAQLMLTLLATGETRALGAATGWLSRPRWSPDGAYLIYLATAAPQAEVSVDALHARTVNSTTAQLLIVPAPGGTPRPLVVFDGELAAPAWSPDGRRIALLCWHDQAPERAQPAAPPDPGDHYARFTRDVLVTRRLPQPSQDGDHTGVAPRQIAIVTFDPAAAAPLALNVLTSTAHDFGPPAWSPDGHWLAGIVTNKSGADFEHKYALYLLDTDAPAPLAPQHLAGPAWLDARTSLAWSPDGASLACCARPDPLHDPAGAPAFGIVDITNGVMRSLSVPAGQPGARAQARVRSAEQRPAPGAGLRRSDRQAPGLAWPGSAANVAQPAAQTVDAYDDTLCWLREGSALLLLSSSGDTVQLSRLSIVDGTLQALTTGEHVVSAFAADPDGQVMVAQIGASLSPGDLYLIEADGALRRLTAINGALLSGLELAPTLHFAARAGGAPAAGWLLPPPGYIPGQRYPAILDLSGGSGVFRLDRQLYAAQGYAVLCRQPHAPLDDAQAADSEHAAEAWLTLLRTACAAYALIDPTRLAVVGGPAAMHLSRLHPGFKATIVDCTQRDWATFELGLAEPRPAPTLLIATADACIGPQLAAELGRRGVTSELVRFPELSNPELVARPPWHRVFQLDRSVAWLRHWLVDVEPAASER